MKITSFFGDTAISEKCTKCGLHQKCESPFTKVYGEGRMETLLVLDKPSQQEDRGRSPYSGQTMSRVIDYFGDIGIDVRTAFWKYNAVQCYTKKVDDAIPGFCRDNLLSVIKRYRPKHIITVGQIAAKTTFGHLCEMPRIESLPFNHIPLHDFNAWIHPTMNPARMNTQNEKAYFARSIHDIVQEIKKDKPRIKVNPFENVEVLTDYDDVLDAIESLYLLEDPLFAWDVEATGLKPHWDRHFITSVGVATRKRVFAFPLYHNDAYDGDLDLSDDVQDAWSIVMKDKRIKKIAHNRKFDETWWEVTTGDTVHGGLQCTATNQHLLDHRPDTKRLKWQAFRRWGIVEYDKKAKPYIESPNKGAKEKNRMHEMPLREQLLYVGADAYLTLKLSDEQDGEYAESDNPKKHAPRLLFHESTDTLKRIEQRGIPCSIEYYEEKELELLDKMDEAQDIIRDDKGVKEFKRRYNKEFKQTSPIDLKTVLFDIKKHPKEGIKRTDKGNISVDEKALKDIDDPICSAILDYRKYHKLNNTYMSQFLRNDVDGRMYPVFSLVIPRSYRGSSFDPNFQNIPKHWEYANVTCRGGLVPDEGMGMGEMDFKGVEVSTSASYHKDPNFIDYLITPGTDMHRDNTCDLWKVGTEQLNEWLADPALEKIFGKIRYHSKNCWTFPQFYGDWYGSCAPELWKQVITKNKMVLPNGVPVLEHIKGHGIMNLADFTQHCKEVEDILWNHRFKVYTEWKNEVNDFYLEHGYVETFMGFRFTGLLDTKQTSNYPIQGTAFHLLLWCLNRLDKWMVREKLRSYIFGQIHDSIVFVWHPAELRYIKEKMTQICTIDLVKEFDWINVPIGIDIELCGLLEDGGNFSNIGDKRWIDYDFTFGGKH